MQEHFQMLMDTSCFPNKNEFTFKKALREADESQILTLIIRPLKGVQSIGHKWRGKDRGGFKMVYWVIFPNNSAFYPV